MDRPGPRRRRHQSARHWLWQPARQSAVFSILYPLVSVLRAKTAMEQLRFRRRWGGGVRAISTAPSEGAHDAPSRSLGLQRHSQLLLPRKDQAAGGAAPASVPAHVASAWHRYGAEMAPPDALKN